MDLVTKSNVMKERGLEYLSWTGGQHLCYGRIEVEVDLRSVLRD